MIDWLVSLIHEANIRAAKRRFVRHPTRANFLRFASLINARSTDQVRRMEIRRGLT